MPAPIAFAISAATGNTVSASSDPSRGTISVWMLAVLSTDGAPRSGCTTSNGAAVVCSTLSVTLPMIQRPRPVRPCVDIATSVPSTSSRLVHDVIGGRARAHRDVRRYAKLLQPSGHPGKVAFRLVMEAHRNGLQGRHNGGAFRLVLGRQLISQVLVSPQQLNPRAEGRRQRADVRQDAL